MCLWDLQGSPPYFCTWIPATSGVASFDFSYISSSHPFTRWVRIAGSIATFRKEFSLALDESGFIFVLDDQKISLSQYKALQYYLEKLFDVGADG